MPITLPTHVTSQEVRENTQNDCILGMLDSVLMELIYTSEQIVFRYLGVWGYKSPLKYIPSVVGWGTTQWQNYPDPSIEGMPTMPDPMKLAVVRIVENLHAKGVSVANGGNGSSFLDGGVISEEQVGDHSVSKQYSKTAIQKANSYMQFITPDVEALLAQYSQSGRFLSM